MRKDFFFWVLSFFCAVQLLVAFVLLRLHANLARMGNETERLVAIQKELTASASLAKALLNKQNETFLKLSQAVATTLSLYERTEKLKKINIQMEQEERHIDAMEKKIASMMPGTVKLADTLLLESRKLVKVMGEVKMQLKEAQKAQGELSKYTRKQARALKKVPDFLFK